MQHLQSLNYKPQWCNILEMQIGSVFSLFDRNGRVEYSLAIFPEHCDHSVLSYNTLGVSSTLYVLIGFDGDTSKIC